MQKKLEMIRKAPAPLLVAIGVLLAIVAAGCIFFVVSRLHPALDISQAKKIVISYYNNKGEWAGQYVMKQINEIKSKSRNNDETTLCVVYEFAYPYMSSISQGADRRTFLFRYTDSRWQVIKMGGYYSC